MAKLKPLLVDACIPIAKFKGDDPVIQQQYTDKFVELIKENDLKILIVEKALSEVHNKFPHLKKSVEDLTVELEAMGKYELIK